MNVDLKTGLLLASLVVSGAGFYYTTQSRLDNLEAKVSKLEKRLDKLSKSKKRNKSKKK
jgi:cell division protein FtsL|tara:strand:- start:956 stop:1132 length:177 start_codon:yes stop_codon:yes gene_type:complete